MRRVFRTAPSVTRVDLHLHTRASTDTGSWFLSRTLMPESFVDPADAYRTVKARGMDMVAITDHNTIRGAMEIAHHPDVIVGVEITTWFPDQPLVALHVLAWGVDEAAWADLDRARRNVFDLVDVLDARNIPHALAHPLHRVGDELTVDHLEICLLLFRMWEGRNGQRPEESNEVGVRIAQAAQPALLSRLSEKHGIPARGDGPPALTAGSDDHSLLESACAWTEVPRCTTPAQVLDHLRAGNVTMAGGHGSPTALAQSVGTLLLKQYADNGAPGLPDALRGVFSSIIHHPLADPTVADRTTSATTAAPGRGHALGDQIAHELRRDRRFVMRYRALSRGADSPQRSRERLRMVTAWLHERALAMALSPDDLSLGRLGARVDALAAAAALAAPYCIAARWMKSERDHARAMEHDYFGAPGITTAARSPRVVMLTDTFTQLNGAAGTMRRLAEWSASQPEVPVTVVTCAPKASAAPGITRLRSVQEWPVPAYADGDLRVGVPSLLELMAAIDASQADVVHAATPGPLGVLGLVAARVMGLPFVASHHTELAQYAMDLTGDRLAAGMVARGLGWFYGQAERVYVPTRVSGAGRLNSGVDPSRLFIFGRGADTARFAPERRTRSMRKAMGGNDAVVALFVGRLSREKGLESLAAAFRRAAATRPQLHLAIVGDGPDRGLLEGLLHGTRHHFLGALVGDPLAAAYASADVFVFPSTTETFGQVVVEAGCSGLPVIVSDKGGAWEQMRPGVTGLVARDGDASQVATHLAMLADDPQMRARMGAEGRRHAAQRSSWDEVFRELVRSYRDVVAPDASVATPSPFARHTVSDGERP